MEDQSKTNYREISETMWSCWEIRLQKLNNPLLPYSSLGGGCSSVVLRLKIILFQRKVLYEEVKSNETQNYPNMQNVFK